MSFYSILSTENCGPSICSMGNNFCILFNLAHCEPDRSRKPNAERGQTASATRIKTKSGTLYSIIRLRGARSSFSPSLFLFEKLFETNPHTTKCSSFRQNLFFCNSGTRDPSHVNVSKRYTISPDCEPLTRSDPHFGLGYKHVCSCILVVGLLDKYRHEIV